MRLNQTHTAAHFFLHFKSAACFKTWIFSFFNRISTRSWISAANWRFLQTVENESCVSALNISVACLFRNLKYRKLSQFKILRELPVNRCLDKLSVKASSDWLFTSQSHWAPSCWCFDWVFIKKKFCQRKQNTFFTITVSCCLFVCFFSGWCNNSGI